MYMRGLWFLVLGLFSAWAQADCSVSSTPADLGSRTAWSLVYEEGTTQIQGGLACSGMIGGASYLRVDVLSTNTGKFALTGPNNSELLYKLQTAQTSGELAIGSSSAIINGGVPTSTFTAAGGHFPLWAVTQRAAALGAIAPGTYTGTVQLRLFYSIALSGGTYAESPGFDRGDTGNFSWGTGTVVSLPISIVVEASCNISGIGSIDFGNQPLIRRFTKQYASVLVSCSKDTAYTLGLDNGQNASSGQRYLKSADGDLIAYEVFKADGLRWGSVGSERWDSATVDPTTTTSSQRLHNASAVIDLDQLTPQPGTYTDVLVLEVAF